MRSSQRGVQAMSFQSNLPNLRGPMRLSASCAALVALAMVCLSLSARAQVSSGEPVKRLREALGVGTQDSLLIETDSAPELFPGVRVVRGQWDDHGASTYVRSAAVVATAHGLEVVTGPSDLTRLGKLGSPFNDARKLSTVTSFEVLLRLTGLLQPADSIVTDPTAISPRELKWLTPGSAVTKIRPPSTTRSGTAVVHTFFVYGRGMLSRVRARADKHGPSLTWEPVARFALTGL